MNTNTAIEYRNLPLAVLTESATNPRRIFEDSALKELAESIRSQGVLSPLLVRPLTDQSCRHVLPTRRAACIKSKVTQDCVITLSHPHPFMHSIRLLRIRRLKCFFS
jgi:hypothetical protein